MRHEIIRLAWSAAVMLPAAGGQARADGGSIVGWGSQVVVSRAALTNRVALAAGGSHSLGLNGDGSIVAWGNNKYGQCNVPAPNAGFTAIAAGGNHNLGLKGDGSIVA